MLPHCCFIYLNFLIIYLSNAHITAFQMSSATSEDLFGCDLLLAPDERIRMASDDFAFSYI